MNHRFILIFSFLVTFGWSQETPKNYEFSLNQAIEHGLKYNYNAVNSGRDIEAAKKKKWETTAMGLPQVNAGLDYQKNFEIQKSVVPAEFFGGNPGEFVEVAFGVKNSMNARASVNQIIFDGSYLVALQASKTYLDFFNTSKQKTDQEVRAQIIQLYGQVLLLEESVAIFESNKKVLETNFFEAQETFKNGLSEEETVEQIAITLESVKSALNNNLRLRDISYQMIKLELGLELDDTLTLTDNLASLAILNMDWALKTPEFQIENNVDYLLGLNNQEQKRLLMLQEKSMALPSLSANYNFGYNAFGDQFEFFTRNQRWLNYSFLGVSLNVPIFSSLARSARTQQAKIELDKAKTMMDITKKSVQLQYEQAKSEYEFSIEEYHTSKKTLELSERIEKKQQIKFKEGISTSFEFAEAQRQLYSAQQSYLQSLVNVINKKTNLEKIIN
jgi:outer membrane protein